MELLNSNSLGVSVNMDVKGQEYFTIDLRRPLSISVYTQIAKQDGTITKSTSPINVIVCGLETLQ